MTTEQRLERIEKKLDQLLGTGKKAKSWVSGKELAKLTGWDNNRLRAMREMGAIQFKRYGKSISYDLDSIPEKYLKVQG
ncbi:hypothetical protein [Flavihumibacter petaseus]|uniref:Helix-turn-helix domain-containing protein n=1 Tax=Flavihumibacter petaseus NBRC 106054 TaxID=1220578 RepID=A0A0E9N1M4_9BACT|nr:hypothetical protein [Flavihumibacter petaseus]GAO43754.1 hypothetical protein FPE01S_02_08600 [Flavihumibacter petaseus NBRC 106054]